MILNGNDDAALLLSVYGLVEPLALLDPDISDPTQLAKDVAEYVVVEWWHTDKTSEALFKLVYVAYQTMKENYYA